MPANVEAHVDLVDPLVAPVGQAGEGLAEAAGHHEGRADGEHQRQAEDAEPDPVDGDAGDQVGHSDAGRGERDGPPGEALVGGWARG